MLGRRGWRGVRRFGLLAVLAMLGAGLVVAPGAFAGHPEVGLALSDFEIDTNANLVVDDPGNIDWAAVNEAQAADRVMVQSDLPSGQNDNSFGQGTKEDTAVPVVVTGSIPPNKSDLKDFGVYVEENANGKFLNLFWTRVQDPSGTTNMDFEFNQSSVLSANGVTPVRTDGDLLIVYELSRGGTQATLFSFTWLDGVTPGTCESANSEPCWGNRTNLTMAAGAAGSINTSAIAAANAIVDSDEGPKPLGALSARTFGEAQIDLALIFDETKCTSFGSAYLKSRSSDSFTSALKDFIAPQTVNLTNCGLVTIRKQTVPDGIAGSFDFTSTVATDPAGDFPAAFSLSDDGSESSGLVLAGGPYTVTEADPSGDGFDLTDISCTESGGATATPNLASRLVSITMVVGGEVDCTFTNTARGAIEITKTAKDASQGQGLHPHAGVTFEVRDSDDVLVGSPVTDANGEACIDGLTVGDTYEVTEIVPDGYAAAGQNPQDIVAAAGDCSGSGSPAQASFVNDPLSEITIGFESLAGDGVTLATSVACTGPDGFDSGELGVLGDDSNPESASITDLVEGTYVCTIVVDP